MNAGKSTNDETKIEIASVDESFQSQLANESSQSFNVTLINERENKCDKNQDRMSIGRYVCARCRLRLLILLIKHTLYNLSGNFSFFMYLKYRWLKLKYCLFVSFSLLTF